LACEASKEGTGAVADDDEKEEEIEGGGLKIVGPWTGNWRSRAHWQFNVCSLWCLMPGPVRGRSLGLGDRLQTLHRKLMHRFSAFTSRGGTAFPPRCTWTQFFFSGIRSSITAVLGLKVILPLEMHMSVLDSSSASL
jgi:hypothetical protein